MCDRHTLGRELERIRAVWPSLAASVAALDGYAEVLHGYTADEVHGAVTLVLGEYDGASAPKPKLLRDAAGRVAKMRRGAVVDVAGSDAYCLVCGTRDLEEIAHPTRPDLPPRRYPAHRVACVRYGAHG